MAYNAMTGSAMSDRAKRRAAQLYIQSDPTVTASMNADPAIQMDNALLAKGSDFSATHGGAGMEGIARVLSGLAGGYFSKKDREGYQAKNEQYEANRLNQLLGNQTPPAAQVSQALSTPITGGPQPPPQGPPPGINPMAGMAPPQTAAQTGIGGGVPQVANALNGSNLGQNYGSAPLRPNPTSPPADAGVGLTPRVLQPGQSARADRRNQGFNSYQSSAYDALEEKAAAQHGIPVELLRSIRLNGERSNADQVSSAGARSVYQFTKETRDNFIKNHGIDPWASPENAVEAAAIHLAGDWKRSGGDPRETALSYIAGPSGKNRGRVSNAYADRVVNGMGAMAPAGDTGEPPPPQTQDVPALPEAPQEPADIPLPERVQSERLSMARKLLQDNLGSGQSATDLMVSARPWLETGLDEDQKSKEAAYQSQVAQVAAKQLGQRQLYNDEASALYKQPLDERTAAILANTQASQAATQFGYQKSLQAQQDAAARERALIEASAKANAPRNMPQKTMNDLATASGDMATQMDLMKGFDPSFSGFVGGKANTDLRDYASETLSNLGLASQDPNTADRQQWWKQYGQWAQGIRHGIYGGALTPQEKQEWDKTTFSQSTPPAQVQSILHNQAVLGARAMVRKINSAIAGNYDPQQIMEQVGPQYQDILKLSQEKTLGENLATKSKSNRSDFNKAPPAQYTRQTRPPGTPRTTVSVGGKSMWRDPVTGKIMSN